MSGHFVAYIRNNSDYKWYLYNDGIVTECSRKNQYKEGMPYILFYKVLKGGPNAPYYLISSKLFSSKSSLFFISFFIISL